MRTFIFRDPTSKNGFQMLSAAVSRGCNQFTNMQCKNLEANNVVGYPGSGAAPGTYAIDFSSDFPKQIAPDGENELSGAEWLQAHAAQAGLDLFEFSEKFSIEVPSPIASLVIGAQTLDFISGTPSTKQVATSDGFGPKIWEIEGVIQDEITFDDATGIFSYDGVAATSSSNPIVKVTDATGEFEAVVTLSIG